MHRKNLSQPKHISEYLSQSYSSKLRDPRWQKKRLERLECSRWKCDECGDSQSELQVHHKWYLKNMEPWDYAMEQLATLCVTCHESAGKLHEELKKYLSFASVEEQKTTLNFLVYKTQQPFFSPCELTNYEDCVHRNQRLAFCFYNILRLAPIAVSNITRLHDHKGLLQVYADYAMTAEQENCVKAAWEECMECHVEFIYTKTLREIVWCNP